MDGEEVRDDAFGTGAAVWRGAGGLGGEKDVLDDGADAVVDAEAGFVPGVKGEEDGVLGEELDAVCEGGADEGWFEGGGVRGVVVEEFGARLVEEFVGGGVRWERIRVRGDLGVEAGEGGVDVGGVFEVVEEDEAFGIEDGARVIALVECVVSTVGQCLQFPLVLISWLVCTLTF